MLTFNAEAAIAKRWTFLDEDTHTATLVTVLIEKEKVCYLARFDSYPTTG